MSPDAPLLIYWKLMGAKTKVKLKKAVPFRAQEVILSNLVYAYLHSSGTSGTLFSRRPILSSWPVNSRKTFQPFLTNSTNITRGTRGFEHFLSRFKWSLTFFSRWPCWPWITFGTLRDENIILFIILFITSALHYYWGVAIVSVLNENPPWRKVEWLCKGPTSLIWISNLQINVFCVHEVRLQCQTTPCSDI